jgi:hypothetical protein
MSELRLPTDLEIRMAAIHQVHLGEMQQKITSQLTKLSRDLALTNAGICGILLLGGYGYFTLRDRIERLENGEIGSNRVTERTGPKG